MSNETSLFCEQSQQLGLGLFSEVADILQGLSLSDVTSRQYKNISSKSNATPLPAQRSSEPVSDAKLTHIPRAYKWLVKHIHNPYPSNSTKEKLAERSGVSVKSISSWFINARRRIGWTTIKKKYFGGSKADTINHAYSVFVQPDPAYPVTAAICSDFLDMQKLAQRLLSENVKGSERATRSDLVVKEGECSQFKQTAVQKRRATDDDDLLEVAVSCSSKRPSPQDRPCKRRRSMSPDESVATMTSGSSKLSSPEPITPVLPSSMSLPSNDLALAKWLSGLPGECEAYDTGSLIINSTASRKRSRSEDDDEPGSKRARNGLAPLPIAEVSNYTSVVVEHIVSKHAKVPNEFSLAYL